MHALINVMTDSPSLETRRSWQPLHWALEESWTANQRTGPVCLDQSGGVKSRWARGQGPSTQSVSNPASCEILCELFCNLVYSWYVPWSDLPVIIPVSQLWLSAKFSWTLLKLGQNHGCMFQVKMQTILWPVLFFWRISKVKQTTHLIQDCCKMLTDECLDW